jgi:hypothetical protein
VPHTRMQEDIDHMPYAAQPTCCVLPKADIAGVAAQLLAVGAALPGCAARGTRCVTLSTPLTSMLTCMTQREGGREGGIHKHTKGSRFSTFTTILVSLRQQQDRRGTACS